MAKELDTTKLDIPIIKQVDLPNTGSVSKSATADLLSIEVVDKPINTTQMDELAFMEEPVEVMLHEATDPNAENPVQVSVNGVNQFFLRGIPQTVRRKYLAVLAGAKRGTITTPEITQNNERVATIRRTAALAYPFSVIQDSPKGAAWLRTMMQG